MTQTAIHPAAQSRADLIAPFLAAAGFAGAECRMLAGDASFRKYHRVQAGGASYVLMDSPPDKEPVAPFVRVDQELVRLGFSAPRIVHADEAQGFLLLEDLGDDLYSRVLSGAPEQEAAIYQPAIQVLAELHRAEIAIQVPPYDDAVYTRELALFTDWYLDQYLQGAAYDDAKAAYEKAWAAVLQTLDRSSPVLVLRDYHADNLLWLPERAGVARVGLLDFQDALMGHAAYDLVSLLEDARRDVSPATQHAMIEAYCDAARVKDAAAFARDYAILGAQRNLKIIGIFHRLNRRDGKPNYLNFIPRVAAHLKHDVQHPALKAVAELLASLDTPLADCLR